MGNKVLKMIQKVQREISFLMITFLALCFMLKGAFPNPVMGQAVPLIPLTSGNLTLDTGIPKFYKCIEHEIKESKNANDDSYFKSEPTKAEVFKCYNTIFKDSGVAQN